MKEITKVEMQMGDTLTYGKMFKFLSNQSNWSENYREVGLHTFQSSNVKKGWEMETQHSLPEGRQMDSGFRVS